MGDDNDDRIDFGAIPPPIDALLQHGVSLSRHDKAAADAVFREALARDPSVLASYFCLYKIHAYGGRLETALAAAEAGLAEAARQAALPADWTGWTADALAKAAPASARFALYTLKAVAFIRLRLGEPEAAQSRLDALATLGASEGMGGAVVADLMRAVA